jgi:prolipoprotein diacylglyceryltransferase
MLPILFSVGAIDVRANTTFFILGCLVGLWVGWKEVKRQTSEAQLPFEPKRILVFFAVFLPFVYLIGWGGQAVSLEYGDVCAKLQKKFASAADMNGGVVGAWCFGMLSEFVQRSFRQNPDIVALVLLFLRGVYRLGMFTEWLLLWKETDGFGGEDFCVMNGSVGKRYPTQILNICWIWVVCFVMVKTKKSCL